ncbi:class I SAM-dependent methyltransferase [Cetobacterium sp. 2A]|uniref:class I SAM-dependent methyltransferase n=1 Tax=unclassified Cetobacterium TaxID=2630983 RepID=UPI00163B87E7|nr:class I SAM-dependent methyltransferase [Cetobacterium sp. 2A]MBC2857139.1 class I SAM-dependent methyltransferase [Cetobacterium sp. 2A]
MIKNSKINKFNNYKNNSKEFFDKMAHKKHGDSFRHYENVLKYLNDIRFEKLLDLGTGTGSLLEKLEHRIENKGTKFYGIDISSKMIEVARGKKLNAEFLNGDSENLPYENEMFDIITCINSFHHYPNPQLVAKEIARVLKLNGKLILGEIWLPPFFKSIVNKLLPYGKSGDFKIYSNSEIEDIFMKENIILEEKKYVCFTNYTYLFKKI